MAKVKRAYFCNDCGYETPKWLGKCPACGAWNTITEHIIAKESSSVAARVASVPKSEPRKVQDIEEGTTRRIDLGNKEVNRVLGGGLVPGSLILLGGEPGIGKSTLSVQLALTNNSLKSLYVSGEESAEQIKMRANRLGIHNEECTVFTETLLENIVAQIEETHPDVVIIDSIQTMSTDLVESSPGSVTQIRECAATLLKVAKSNNIAIFIIGHITKDGSIAGPKILEHIVDVVLQFEGDGNNVRKPLTKCRQEGGVIVELTNRLGGKEAAEEGVSCAANVSSVGEAYDQGNDSCNYGNHLIATDDGDRVKRIHYQYVDGKHRRRNSQKLE